MNTTTNPPLNARMALMNLQLAYTKLQALHEELNESRADLDALAQTRLSMIRVSGAIQEVEKL